MSEIQRTLDRLVEFDERSRAYGVQEFLPSSLKGYTHRCWAKLDQGREGACVGFAWTHELAATPVTVRKDVDAAFANRIYREAQKIDAWPGENYEGTSVIAGAKIVQRMGYMGEYRWAFGIDEVMSTLSGLGPVILGIPWLDSMFDTRPSGLLDVTGREVGGHALLARGLTLKKRLKGEAPGPLIRLRNSWGPDWGYGGDAFIRPEDLERLLRNYGEACVPVQRTRPPRM